MLFCTLSSSNKFALKKSINEQMKYISELRESNPEQAKVSLFI